MLEIDEALLGPLSRTPWVGEYDLIGGLAGLGVYALERLPRASAAGAPRTDRRAPRRARGGDAGRRRLVQPGRSGSPSGSASSIPRVTTTSAWRTGCPAVVADPRRGLRRRRGRGAGAAAARQLGPLARSPDASSRERCPASPAASIPGRAHRPDAAGLVLRRSRHRRDAPRRRPRRRRAGVGSARPLDIARAAAARVEGSTDVRDAGLCHGAAGARPSLQPDVSDDGRRGARRRGPLLVRADVRLRDSPARGSPASAPSIRAPGGEPAGGRTPASSKAPPEWAWPSSAPSPTSSRPGTACC